MSGKVTRLKKLYHHSDRLFVVPMDHGITLGPVKGLDNVEETVAAVLDGGADAVIVHKGLVRYLEDIISSKKGDLIVHVSASTNLATEAKSNYKEIVATVEEAIRLGATAVSNHVNLGSDFEAEQLRDMAVLANECDKWGMPLLAMMYVRDGVKDHAFDSNKIRHAARVAEELGADLVKVNYSGSKESFKDVVSGVRIPVLIAGGDKMDTEQDVLDLVEDAIDAGANGISIGRNIFQSDHPKQLATKIRSILNK